MTPDPGLTHLLGRAGLVEHRVRLLVAQRRADDPAPDDPFRGLYLSDEAAEQVLAAGSPGLPAGTGSAEREVLEREADRAEAAGALLPLRRLARAARLSDLDVELLVVALLPDLDPRFERLYGYLNDDVTRRRASLALALGLAGSSPLVANHRARVEASRPLVAQRLLVVEDSDRPLLTRGLRVPDRVTAQLLGDEAPEAILSGLLEEVEPYDCPLAASLARVVGSGTPVHLREQVHATAAPVAAAAFDLAGLGQLVLDLVRLAGGPDADEAVAVAVREALLLDAGLVAGPVEALADQPGALRRLTGARVPVVLVGSATWDPRWSDQTPLCLDVAPAPADNRLALWRRELDGSAVPEAAASVGHLSLGPAQVRRAASAARLAARLRGDLVRPEDVQRGVRAQNAGGLERLARRIEPEVGWDDLVLTPEVELALHDLTARARHRDQVLTQWRMRRGGGRGHGVTALFAGDSGTGKTMSAEVIAHELGLDLYTVNLATVIDKYIGETEKNLERIFTEAAGVNAVLFFDEADAIFGKRSDVHDAHDRYANIESAYLLQRLETFDGLAVLATNLRSNIDDAFVRRLDAIIEFPAPTPELRVALWRTCLAPPLPVGAGVDYPALARFELAGGNIRSASTTAAYLAAARAEPVGMAELVAAVEQEYRKLGRLIRRLDFDRS